MKHTTVRLALRLAAGLLGGAALVPVGISFGKDATSLPRAASLPVGVAGPSPVLGGAGASATRGSSVTPGSAGAGSAPVGNAAGGGGAPGSAGASSGGAGATDPTLAGPSATRDVLPAAGRKRGPDAPPPTARQLIALRILEAEAATYEQGAKEYRDTLTLIVRHHYEEKRRRILDELDKEIAVEKKGLEEARGEAIARLEEFIARYSGVNAHPEATPDAMYRLAALYEERARSNEDARLEIALKPAIGLYRRIISEFPSYEELAGVYYYLGHAFTDSARLDEGQQAWRALVCRNKFSLESTAGDFDRIQVQALEQDRPETFWEDWYNKNPVPLDQLTSRERAKAEKKIGVREEELFFRDPYADCEAIPQKVLAGQEPRYNAEVWWQLGNFHFEQLDAQGGPYALNRAVSAYERSTELKKPPLYGVALYKRAWTYFKQQRYKTAVDGFVQLLRYADEQEAKTGDPGADFRNEAYTYIAGSLAYVDFDGPPAYDPYIPRSDVLDVETDPLVAEDKMSIAIRRVQDPALIPQNEKWTPEIYKALALEFTEVSQHRNAILTLELTLEKFPLDRSAPQLQNKVATLYDQLTRLAPDGAPIRDEYAAKALAARTKLAQYVGTTNWTIANKDDPEALIEAEKLVREGLFKAAADHTNYARAFAARSQQVSDRKEERALIEKAIEEYRLAETAWFAYVEQDPTSPDAYESRFWLADARYRVVVLQIALGRTPAPAEISNATAACADVRDSNEDDRYLPAAAQYLVALADSVLKNAYAEYASSGGARGVKPQETVEFQGDGEGRTVIKLAVPEEVKAAVKARDEYNDRLPAELDPQKNGDTFAFQAAEYFFVYGEFGEARRRFEPILKVHCGKDEWGYKAWEKLLSMSNFERDVDRSRVLAEGQTCEFDEESKAKTAALREPVRQGVAYIQAWKLYDAAEKAPEGPERAQKWRAAAAAYQVALEAGPDRNEAPEAAMNGAFAHKQVGEYDRAIAMYQLFIAKYGNAEKLAALQHGSGDKPPEPASYEKRVGFLKNAYDALGGAYVLFFDYPKAAATYDTISATNHFSDTDRKEAASRAMTLFGSLGDARGLDAARTRFFQLGASAEDRAEADWTIANSELERWDPLSPNQGANAAARSRADFALRNYYDANQANPAAAKRVVEAAYWIAKAKRSARDGLEGEWWHRTMKAFDNYLRVAPARSDGGSEAVGSHQASLAAEGEFTLLDAEIRKKFDYDSGHHHYRGTPRDVLATYRKDAELAKQWFDKLQYIIDHYASREWATAAVARQGTLYDSLRTGLYNVRPPELEMFDKKTEALLRRAEGSDNEALQERADEVRLQVEGAWRDARDQELRSADQIMVNRFGNSVVLARKYDVSNPSVVKAIQRLAFFTDVIGAAKMKEYADQIPALNYSEGMFLRIRPGLVTAPPPNPMPAPAPAQAGEP